MMMKLRLVESQLFALLLALMSTAVGAVANEPGPRHQRPNPGESASTERARVIVKYRANSTLRRIQSAGNGEGAAGRTSAPLHARRLSELTRVPLRDGRVLGPHTQALFGDGVSSQELARRLRARPEVEWVEVDQRRRILAVPDDPLLQGNQRDVTPASGQWYLRAPTAEVVSAINALGAWTVTTGSPTITVAVLDTGVRPDHPDLQGKLHRGYDFIALDRGGVADTAQDGDGRDPDPTDPGDWNNAGDCGPGEPASSSSWHGTAVSGYIGAATNNSIGIAGVGWQVMVLPVRVLGRCGGYDSDIVAGMRWAGGVSDNVGVNTVVNVRNPNPARVLNMSLGSAGTCSSAYREAIAELRAAGVTTVVASGNDTGQAVSTPANCPGALAVAGIRHLGSKVGFSNIGPEVTIAAPAGNCVNLNGTCLYPLVTTDNLGSRGPGVNGYSDGTRYSVGTSFAAPLVAGTIGLMLSVDPSLTPTKIREILQTASRPFPTTRTLAADEEPVPVCRAPNGTDQLECFCTTSTCGAGMLDAASAVVLTQGQRQTTMDAAQRDVIRLHQAFYGTAPSNTQLSKLVDRVGTDGASGLAASLAADFSVLSDAELARRVLANLNITAGTVTNPGSFDLLLAALGQFFGAYGTAARGQIVLNLAGLLSNLQSDPTFGAAARLFMSQTMANFSYSSLATSLAQRSLACTDGRCTIAGYVSGLDQGKQVTLLNNGGNPTVVSAIGAFSFGTPVAAGSAYSVTVGTQPAGQTCTVLNGSGANVAAPVVDVFVSCRNR